MGCCPVWSADVEVLLRVEINLSKSPDDAGDSPVFLSPRDCMAYLSNVVSQRSDLTSNNEDFNAYIINI